MKQKIFLTLLVIILVISSFFAGRYSVKPQTITVTDTITPKIEKYYITNDSLSRINDSINFKVAKIEKVYETTVDDIIRNNPRDDYNFFTSYIERYCSHNNSDTTQNN